MSDIMQENVKAETQCKSIEQILDDPNLSDEDFNKIKDRLEKVNKKMAEVSAKRSKMTEGAEVPATEVPMVEDIAYKKYARDKVKEAQKADEIVDELNRYYDIRKDHMSDAHKDKVKQKIDDAKVRVSNALELAKKADPGVFKRGDVTSSMKNIAGLYGRNAPDSANFNHSRVDLHDKIKAKYPDPAPEREPNEILKLQNMYKDAYKESVDPDVIVDMFCEGYIDEDMFLAALGESNN